MLKPKESKINYLNYHNKNKKLTQCLKLETQNIKILDHIFKIYNQKPEKYNNFNLHVDSLM